MTESSPQPFRFSLITMIAALLLPGLFFLLNREKEEGRWDIPAPDGSVIHSRLVRGGWPIPRLRVIYAVQSGTDKGQGGTPVRISWGGSTL